MLISNHITPPIARADSLSVDDLKTIAAAEAAVYDVDPKVMMDIVSCESNWDTNVRSTHIFKDGRQENSWGLAQINLDKWPITKEEATNPFFSLNLLAQKLSMKQGHFWSCYKPSGES